MNGIAPISDDPPSLNLYDVKCVLKGGKNFEFEVWGRSKKSVRRQVKAQLHKFKATGFEYISIRLKKDQEAG